MSDLTTAPDELTTHAKLLSWVDEIASLTEPDSVYWCDGSAEEYDRLAQVLIDAGTFERLSRGGGGGGGGAIIGDARAERTHREGDDVHRAALHRALEEVVEGGAHLGRVAPVVGRAGVLLLLGADEGPVFDAGDVAGVGEGEVGVRALGFVEALEGAGVDQDLRQAVVLLGAAVAPVDGVGFGQGGDFVNPAEEFRVGRSSSGAVVRSLIRLSLILRFQADHGDVGILVPDRQSRYFSSAIGKSHFASKGRARVYRLVRGAIDSLDLFMNRVF